MAFLASGFVVDAGAILISTIEEGAASEPADGSVVEGGTAARTGFSATLSAEDGFISLEGLSGMSPNYVVVFLGRMY